jgi:hypothetical protein
MIGFIIRFIVSKHYIRIFIYSFCNKLSNLTKVLEFYEEQLLKIIIAQCLGN